MRGHLCASSLFEIKIHHINAIVTSLPVGLLYITTGLKSEVFERYMWFYVMPIQSQEWELESLFMYSGWPLWLSILIIRSLSLMELLRITKYFLPSSVLLCIHAKFELISWFQNYVVNWLFLFDFDFYFRFLFFEFDWRWSFLSLDFHFWNVDFFHKNLSGNGLGFHLNLCVASFDWRLFLSHKVFGSELQDWARLLLLHGSFIGGNLIWNCEKLEFWLGKVDIQLGSFRFSISVVPSDDLSFQVRPSLDWF